MSERINRDRRRFLGTAIMTIAAAKPVLVGSADAGTGSIEADTSGHIHMLRNETTSVAETVVTFLVPVGAPIRTDLPDPGTCPF